MTATCQTTLQDEHVYPVLNAIAVLYGRVLRLLYVDRYVRGRPLKECKREYIARYGLTARQVNAIVYDLHGTVRAARESRQHRMATLRDRIAATEKAIGRLQKQDRALASGKGKAAHLTPHERAERRCRVRCRLHQKKRRLAILRARLEAEQGHQGPPSLCFGSRTLFRAQFHLADNSFACYAEWLRAWREARSGSFFCLGSKDETAGNQTCTLLPDGTLRLRVPHALAGQDGTHVVMSGLRVPYGQEVIDAARAAAHAISYRFVRTDGAWYVHATTERPAAERVTSRQAGALGVDLNPHLVAVAVAYSAFSALLLSRAEREGVDVIDVNPAYTSVIGKVKFMARYGLSPHAAAAVAIARRGLGCGERLRSGSALPLPVRNRGRHV